MTFCTLDNGSSNISSPLNSLEAPSIIPPNAMPASLCLTPVSLYSSKLADK